MFDFDGQLTAIQQEEADKRAAETKKSNRISEIGAELVEQALRFRDKYSLGFDYDRSPGVVRFEAPSGQILQVTIHENETFDLAELQSDVNARSGQRLNGLSDADITRAIIKWMLSLPR